MKGDDVSMEKKIVNCEILLGRYTNDIRVTFEDGEVKVLFSYYNDELSFCEVEFLGLTEEEAHDLFHRKDIEYLRS